MTLQQHDGGRILADRDLVNSMVSNLHCIGYAGAREIVTALQVRAAEPGDWRNVSQATVGQVLRLLPALPDSNPGPDYRYRVGDAIAAARDLLAADASARLRA